VGLNRTEQNQINKELVEAIKKDAIKIPKIIKDGATLGLGFAQEYGSATPLHIAAAENNFLAAKYLMEAGADVNAKDNKNDETPLMYAAKKAQSPEVTLLLLSHPDIDVKAKTKPVVRATAGSSVTLPGETARDIAGTMYANSVSKLLKDAEKGIRPSPEEFGLKLPLKKKSMTEHAKRTPDSGKRQP